ncbi:hypothetical protein evm_011733 [Chilo suppressalis]|nr:hypothetical protein evm_011733 [Chilo suppressalis]
MAQRAVRLSWTARAVIPETARMSHARATALICACALFAIAFARPAPALPPPATTKKCAHKEAKMMQQDKSIVVVRKIPVAYFYPFSLWPVPKYQPRSREDTHEIHHYKRNQKNVHRKNKR